MLICIWKQLLDLREGHFFLDLAFKAEKSMILGSIHCMTVLSIQNYVFPYFIFTSDGVTMRKLKTIKPSSIPKYAQ